MLDTADLLQLDQEDLETVIPSVGGRVCIVNGRGRGEVGVLASLDEEKYCVSVRIEGGRTLDGIEYEDVCKLSR